MEKLKAEIEENNSIMSERNAAEKSVKSHFFLSAPIMAVAELSSEPGHMGPPESNQIDESRVWVGSGPDSGGVLGNGYAKILAESSAVMANMK